MTGAPPSPPGTTVATVARRWGHLAGRTITVSGEVDSVIGRHAVAIGDGDFVGDARLLVLTAVPLPVVPGRKPGNALLMDDQVRATGPARPFDRARAERELGVALADPGLLDWLGQPAIAARSLDVTPRRQSRGVADVPVSTADLTADPGAFRGQTVRASGVIIRPVGPASFLLDGQVLVTYGAGPVPDRPPVAGQFILVSGQFRPFDHEAYAQELGRALPVRALAAFDGPPAIGRAKIRPLP